MLGSLRRGADSFFSKMLLAVLVLSFAFWGVGDMVTGGSNNEIASVGDRSISLKEYQREIQSLQRSLGNNFSPELLKQFNLYQTTLNNMISRTLIEEEAERLGLNISDEAMIAYISEDDNFSDENGEFDKGLFYQVLQSNKMNEAEYLDMLRSQIASELLLKTFNIVSLAPNELATQLYAAKQGKREIEIFAVDEVFIDKKIDLNEAEIRKFYEENKTRYRAPEYRALHYLTLAPEKILEDITISRQEAFDTYTKNLSQYTQPEMREVVQLLYREEVEANKAYNLLKQGKSMAQTSKEIQPISGKPQDLGRNTKAQLKIGADAIFSSDPGEYTPPIQSQFGWHVFHVTSIIKSHATPFEENRDKIERELRVEKAENELLKTAEQIEDAIAAGDTLKVIAEQMGFPLITTEPVNRSGQRSDNIMVIDTVRYTNLLQTAFSLEAGASSDLLSENDGTYYIVQVDQIIQAREKAFEEVRGAIMKDFKIMKQRQRLKEEAEEASKRIKENAYKHSSNYQLTISRQGIVEGDIADNIRNILGASMLSNLFSLTESEPVSEPIAYEDGFLIARLKKRISEEVLSAEALKDKQDFLALKRTLKEEYTNEILEQYVRYLRTKYPIEINQALMQAIIEQQ